MFGLMGRIRRRAAVAILACMTLGVLSLASMSHGASQQPGTPAAAPCHASEGSPGVPADEPVPHCPQAPCQLAIPLLCCAQPAAADAGGPNLSPSPTLATRAVATDPALRPAARCAQANACVSACEPPRERSVVLQV